MWIPKSAEEIEQVAKTGNLQETATFDAKRELPKDSRELTKDIAAMANDGGVLLFGIAEDPAGKPTLPSPIPLKGAPERIDHIVRTCIDQPPSVTIRAFEDSPGSGVGYIVVAVPASQAAPLMVIVNKDHRYYGRSATGNVILTEGEVSRLYNRRTRWDVDVNALLTEVISDNSPTSAEQVGCLFVFLRPVSSPDDLVARAQKSRTADVLLNELLDRTVKTDIFPRGEIYPDFSTNRRWHRRAEGWIAFLDREPEPTADRPPERTLDIRINSNGVSVLLCCAATRRYHSEPGGLVLDEHLIAGLTARMIYMLGALYDEASYLGDVDIAVAVTGIRGAETNYMLRDIWRHVGAPVFDRPEYRGIERVPATVMLTDHTSVAKKLILPLTDAVTEGLLDPFGPKPQR